MAYNYGPPPPAPAPAAPTGAPTGYPAPYGQSYQQPPQRGGHGGRGRGGPDRGGFQQPAQQHSYAQQPAYGQHNSTPYYHPQQPQGAYAQPPPQPPQQQQQQWHPEQAQQHVPQPPSHAPLPAQNYHPNFAPQMYHQQPQPYNGQPPYQPAPQPPQHYGPAYTPPAPQPGPPAQQWAGHPQPAPNQGQYGGGGRGRGYGDRGGGHKGQMMGPPIRLGFDGGAQTPPAPVSNLYPPQPYGAPQGPPAPYPPAPYAGYPPPAPYAAASPPYDGHNSHNSHNPRHHNRGGFHNNKSRPQFGGDKTRNRNQRGGTAQTPPTTHQKPDAASAGKKKKRKTNTLGLTPGDGDEEEFEDEEERLYEQYGADAPDVQDIAAWISERRANFPTARRIQAKKAESAAATSSTAPNGDAKQNGDDRKAHLEQKAEKLRKQLEKVESSIKRKREQQDEGDDMRDINLSSSPSSVSKSDDEKPEVMTTRPEPSSLPPPPKKADPRKQCKYFSTGGNCGKRGKCRFVHDPVEREQALKARELNGGRPTLEQRLILNDKEQEDLTIVESLKYLQDKGMLRKTQAPSTTLSGAAASNAQPEPEPSTLPPNPIKNEPTTKHGLPPIPPPTLNSNGPGKYTGWNLSGFGNTGVVD